MELRKVHVRARKVKVNSATGFRKGDPMLKDVLGSERSGHTPQRWKM